MSNERHGAGSAVAIAIAAIALVVAVGGIVRRPPSSTVAQGTPGILTAIRDKHVIDAGYGVYPPYTMEDAATGKVSGYSIDLVEAIGKALGVRVAWHRINWDTMAPDLKRGAFDVVADPIFLTIPRAPEFAFSEPYAYFPDGIAVVRIDETRFKSFGDLDARGITINVGLGQASEALVRAHFSKATIQPVPTGTDNMRIFADVLAGRSDVAVADLPNAKRAVDEHPTKLKALWMGSPPAYMPAGFALRPDDRDGAEFFSVCIRNLRSTGVMAALEGKYDLPSLDEPKSPSLSGR